MNAHQKVTYDQGVGNLCDQPLAAVGLISYRAKGQYGWIMIGAKDVDDAFGQARQSNSTISRDSLQCWNGESYEPV